MRHRRRPQPERCRLDGIHARQTGASGRCRGRSGLLAARARRVVGGHGWAATPSLLGVIGGLLALVGRAGRLGFGARLGFQLLAGRIKLGA